MSNVGKWDGWYATGLDAPQAYGDEITYRIAGEFLSGLAVADWGCGKGFFSTIHDGEYVGVDGSATPFATVTADLVEYREPSEGILLRHVLEHDHNWKLILDNALASFTKRMVLVLFTPLQDVTRVLAGNPNGVPDIGFAVADITSCFGLTVRWTQETFNTNTQYGVETVFLLERT